jgi:prolyl-tRNA editing enzyme YbaK/EbsC (Cys-tRNA(Pro) deacylase)
MIAMRHMAPQDIVFLIGSPAHFQAYCNLYTADQVPNNLKSYYEKGMNTFGYAGSSQEIHPRVFETLNAAGVTYEVVGHSQFNRPIRSPEDFAQAAQCKVGAVAKSILLKSVEPEALVMVVLPNKASIDLEAVKRTLGLSSVSLVNRKDVEALTSQQMNGISPVGHDIISILMDESLFEHPSVFVGTGRAGQELKIGPEQLQQITNARKGTFSL